MKNVLKSIIFAILLVLIIQIVGISLLPQSTMRKYGYKNTMTYPILEEKENQIDVLAVGDSLTYSSVSPMEVWDQYGYTMYDCSTQGMTVKKAYEYIKIATKHEHPKIILLESNILFRNAQNVPWHNKLKDYLYTYFPILKYHNNWKKIGEPEGEYLSEPYKGYVYITTKTPFRLKHQKLKPLGGSRINSENSELFLKIIELCKENNIKLVLISTPSRVSWRMAKHNATNQVAKKYNLEYIDLNLVEELKIDWYNETKDSGDHLNHFGAKKISRYLGEYLHQTNLLTDKRTDSEYKQWHKVNKNYQSHS